MNKSTHCFSDAVNERYIMSSRDFFFHNIFFEVFERVLLNFFVEIQEDLLSIFSVFLALLDEKDTNPHLLLD